MSQDRMDVEQLQEDKEELLRNRGYQEELDRITAVRHLTVEHFRTHTKIQGYYEDRDMGHLFGCDRLMKLEDLYGRIQLAYNPNRKRSFIFANLKTSRYDTVSSRYQKEMKEYQRKSLLKGENQNRAFVSKGFSQAAVLLEKADTKPWGEHTVRTYYHRVNMEALRKTMPFLSRKEEQDRLSLIAKERKKLQQRIQENINQGNFQENEDLRKRQTKRLQEENFLGAMLARKFSTSRYVMRRMNYAFDIQKHEMFEYYKHRFNEMQQEEALAATAEAGDDEEKDT